MTLHDLSIRTRLLILTGLGFLMMALLIAIGLYTSQVQHNDMARLAERDIPLMSETTEIRRDVLRNWVNTLYLTQVTEPAMVAQITAEVEKNSAHISELFATMENPWKAPWKNACWSR